MGPMKTFDLTSYPKLVNVVSFGDFSRINYIMVSCWFGASVTLESSNLLPHLPLHHRKTSVARICIYLTLFTCLFNVRSCACIHLHDLHVSNTLLFLYIYIYRLTSISSMGIPKSPFFGPSTLETLFFRQEAAAPIEVQPEAQVIVAGANDGGRIYPSTQGWKWQMT